MESPSRILEALATWRGDEEAQDVLADAARFPTLLYQDCEECERTGRQIPRPVMITTQHVSASNSDVGVDSCLSCGGSGVVPTEKAVEEVRHHLITRPNYSSYFTSREHACQILMALRTIGDEG